MIDLTPFHLQVIGAVILIGIGLGFLAWVVRRAIGIHRGRPIYMLPDTSPDEQDDEADDENIESGGGDIG